MSSTVEAGQIRAELRWPAVVAVAVMLTFYLLTPESFVPKWIILAISVAMFVPLIILNPRRLTRETSWSRWASIALALLLSVANMFDVVWIVQTLIDGSVGGVPVLMAAVQVWVGNVVSFSLVYWELDRGGPVARRTLTRLKLPVADFKFPQDEDGQTVAEVKASSSQTAGWRPGYIDYLYMSATNTMAFSPTDVMPLSARAKMLMLVQSVTGFVLLTLVIARSVNILA